MGRKLKERWLFRQTWVLKARVMAALWKLCGSLDLREAIVLANLFSFVIFSLPDLNVPEAQTNKKVGLRDPSIPSPPDAGG